MLSRFTLIGVLLLGFVCLCVAAAPYPCTYTSQATQKNYDLSNAYRDPSKGQKDFQTVFANDQSTFNVNVCGQSAAACNPANGVCQQTTGNAYYGNGDASKLAFSDYPGSADGVAITYPSGSGALCPGNVIRKSVLNIKCDTSAGDGIIDSMSESSTPPCTYTINMRSKWACPVQPGKPPKTGGGGLSGGSIILIIVACLVPVYLVVGAIVKWKVYGAEPMSIDIIPNVDFWTALPFLVKDGSVYFVRKVTCNRVCGEYSEI